MTGLLFAARGPSEPPCCSGRDVSVKTHRSSRKQRVTVSAQLQTAPNNLRNRAARTKHHVLKPASSAASISALNWSLDITDTDGFDDGSSFGGSNSDTATRVEAQPLSNRPLKINVDLLLYRAKQARITANHEIDGTNRKVLYKEAEDALQRCLAIDGTDPRVYVSLGRLLLQQKRYQAARQVYEDGCAVTQGTNAFIWTAWAYLETKVQDFGKARQYYSAAITADDTHAAAWHGWAMLEKQQGNYVKARDLLLKGLQKTKDRPNPYLYQSMAVLAADMDLVDEAREWFIKGTANAVGRASHAMWQAWAVMEAEKGNQAQAPYLFSKAVEVNNKSRYAYSAWGMFEKKKGRRYNARRLFEKGWQLNNTDPALLQAWAILETEDENYEKAAELFELASQADPSHVHVWQAWGVMEFRRKNFDRARQLFQQGVWADPGHPDVAVVFQAWGVLEGVCGNYAQARTLFKAGLKADPQNNYIWTAWIALEEEYGALERANQLRNARRTTRTEYIVPRGFSTTPDKLDASSLDASNPVMQVVQKWFDVVETTAKVWRERSPLSEFLDPLQSVGDGAARDVVVEPLSLADQAAVDRAVASVVAPQFSASSGSGLNGDSAAERAVASELDVKTPSLWDRPRKRIV